MFQGIRPVELDAIFGALADASRRSILSRLTAGETSVGDLARPLDMTLPAVLKHLRVLEDAGLVSAVKLGRVKRCQLNTKPLRAVNNWIEDTCNFWTTQLDGLSGYLESNGSSRPTPEEKSPWPQRHRRSASRSAVSIGSHRRKSSRHGRTRKS